MRGGWQTVCARKKTDAADFWLRLATTAVSSGRQQPEPIQLGPAGRKESNGKP
jgi:hypothetical protein